MAIVVDASVGLKWVLEEPESHLAEALVRYEPHLMVPDFWLNEATNVLWLQVRRKVFTADEAREALSLLKALVEPTPTASMDLHEVALNIGVAVNHSTYDTLYMAFAVAMGASIVVAADGRFIQSMRTHPDPTLSAMAVSLEDWTNQARTGPTP